MEKVCSVAEAGSWAGSAPSDLWVAFWAATMLSGLLPGPPREAGRLCQESVPDLAGGVVEGEARMDFASDERESAGASFSLVGEVDVTMELDLSLASGSTDRSRGDSSRAV